MPGARDAGLAVDDDRRHVDQPGLAPPGASARIIATAKQPGLPTSLAPADPLAVELGDAVDGLVEQVRAGVLAARPSRDGGARTPRTRRSTRSGSRRCSRSLARRRNDLRREAHPDTVRRGEDDEVDVLADALGRGVLDHLVAEAAEVREEVADRLADVGLGEERRQLDLRVAESSSIIPRPP